MNLWQKILALFGIRPVPKLVLTPPAPPPPNQSAPFTPPTSHIPLKQPFGLPPGGHFSGRDREQMMAEYRYLWSICSLSGPMADDAKRAASFLRENQGRYQGVAVRLGMPWFIVGVISIMEMGLNFRGTILNGDDFTKPTHNFPPHLGPWASWEEAALWGLRYEAKGWNFNLGTFNWRDVGACFYFCESYNGHDARQEPQGSLTRPPNASPYIYSGTPFYKSGKKQENPTRFDPNLVSEQPGCMAVLWALQESGVLVFS